MALRINNLANAAVGVAAAIAVPANPNRRRLLLVQTTANAVRIGGIGVTAATGYRLGQNERLELSGDYVPTSAIYAIREGGADGNLSGVEIVDADQVA